MQPHSTIENQVDKDDADASYETSRRRQIVIGVGIGAVVLGLALTIFFVLSNGFSRVADKAAEVFVPSTADEEDDVSSTRPMAPKASESVPSSNNEIKVPGL